MRVAWLLLMASVGASVSIAIGAMVETRPLLAALSK